MKTKTYVSESGERAPKITEALIKSGFEFLPKDNDKKNRLDKIKNAKDYVIIVDSSQSTDNLVQWEWSNILEEIWDQPEKKVIPVISNDVIVPSFLYDWTPIRYSSSDQENDISEKVIRAFSNGEEKKDIKTDSVKDIDKGCRRLNRLLFLEQQASLLAKVEDNLNKDEKMLFSALRREQRKGDIESQFETYSKLGAMYLSNGNLDRAAKCYSDILKKFFEKNLVSEDIAKVFLQLGHVLRKQKRFQEAKDILERAIVTCDKSNSIDPNIIAIKVELAEVLYESNDLESAKEILENIVTDGQKSFGVFHPTMAANYQKLGLVLKKLKQYESAQVYLEKAVEITSKSMGIGNPIVTETYLNLVNVSKITKKPTQIEKSLKANSIIFTSHLTKACPSKPDSNTLCTNFLNDEKKDIFFDESIVCRSINRLISATKEKNKKKIAIKFSSNTHKSKKIKKTKASKSRVNELTIGGELIE